MKREKNALMQDYTWNTITEKERAEEMQGGTQRYLLPQGIHLASDLFSSLDAHVTQGGLCYRVLGI